MSTNVHERKWMNAVPTAFQNSAEKLKPNETKQNQC